MPEKVAPIIRQHCHAKCGRAEQFRSVAKVLESEKQRWKDGPVRIVCSDGQLVGLAQKIIKQGSSLVLSKQEVGRYFAFSKILTCWESIPSYTRFVVGGGVAVSSPELDLFRSMAWLHDEAARACWELDALKKVLQEVPDTVQECVQVTIEIIERIAGYIAVDPALCEIPWWLTKMGDNRLFNLPARLVPDMTTATGQHPAEAG